MSKNKQFRQQYIVNIKGISTNGFIPELFEKALYGLVDAFDEQYKHTSVTVMEVMEIEPRTVSLLKQFVEKEREKDINK